MRTFWIIQKLDDEGRWVLPHHDGYSKYPPELSKAAAEKHFEGNGEEALWRAKEVKYV